MCVEFTLSYQDQQILHRDPVDYEMILPTKTFYGELEEVEENDIKIRNRIQKAISSHNSKQNSRQFCFDHYERKTTEYDREKNYNGTYYKNRNRYERNTNNHGGYEINNSSRVRRTRRNIDQPQNHRERGRQRLYSDDRSFRPQ